MASKLTDAYKEQIRNMREDGKKYSEIRDFFKDIYKLTIFDADIAAEMRKNKGTRKATKRAKDKKNVEPSLLSGRIFKSSDTKEDNSDEFVSHIQAAFALYKKGFISKVEAVIEKE